MRVAPVELSSVASKWKQELEEKSTQASQEKQMGCWRVVAALRGWAPRNSAHSSSAHSSSFPVPFLPKVCAGFLQAELLW